MSDIYSTFGLTEDDLKRFAVESKAITEDFLESTRKAAEAKVGEELDKAGKIVKKAKKAKKKAKKKLAKKEAEAKESGEKATDVIITVISDPSFQKHSTGALIEALLALSAAVKASPLPDEVKDSIERFKLHAPELMSAFCEFNPGCKYKGKSKPSEAEEVEKIVVE